MGVAYYCRTCYNCRTNGGACGMEILILAIVLMAADQVRVKIQFGKAAQFLTGFSVALFGCLTAFDVGTVFAAAVTASIFTVFFETNAWIKRVVNAASFVAASAAACGWVYYFGNDLAALVAAGLMFEVVNFTTLGFAFVFREHMTLGELANEWPSTAYLALFAPFVGFLFGEVLLQVPILFPFIMGGLIAFLKPSYVVFSGTSLLRGSWHTTPDTFQSLSKLSPTHNRYG